MARPLLYDGFVVLNCDVLFHPALLEALLTSRHETPLLVGEGQDYQRATHDVRPRIEAATPIVNRRPSSVSLPVIAAGRLA